MRLTALLAIIILSSPSCPGVAGVPDEVRQNMEARVEVGECPGMIVGLVSPEGTSFAAAGRTRAGGMAITPETVFEIGSISKTFTTLLYQLAVDGGIVKPSDELAAFLPSGLALPPGVAVVSLSDLATHRSGLPRMPDNFKPADLRNPYADYTPQQLYAWLCALKKTGAGQFEYSNAGMGLLGHCLELKTESRYEALVRSWIAGPLALPDTCVTLGSSQRRRSAVPHAGGGPIPMWDIPTLAGAGALRSTARDMLRWAAMQAGVIDSPLAAAMKKCQQPRTRTGRPGEKAALGWLLTSAKGGTIVWHNGGTGGTRSWTGFIRERRTAVVVLANGTEEIDDIGLHLLSPDTPLRIPQKEAAIPTSALEKCEGVYALGDARLHVRRDGLRLSVQLTGQVSTPAFARSETEFFLRQADARLVFEPGADGRMTAVTLHQNGREQKARRLAAP